MKIDMKRGFTLIEIIVTIALLGILVLGFLPVLTSGFMGIVRAGSRSKVIYEDQEQAEYKITQEPLSDSKEMIVTFPALSDPIVQSGEEVTAGSIKMFIPVY